MAKPCVRLLSPSLCVSSLLPLCHERATPPPHLHLRNQPCCHQRSNSLPPALACQLLSEHHLFLRENGRFTCCRRRISVCTELCRALFRQKKSFGHSSVTRLYSVIIHKGRIVRNTISEARLYIWRCLGSVCVCVFVCVAEGPADGLTAAVFTGSTAQASERGMIGNGLNEIKLLSA